jgi:hypothetical protein
MTSSAGSNIEGYGKTERLGARAALGLRVASVLDQPLLLE